MESIFSNQLDQDFMDAEEALESLSVVLNYDDNRYPIKDLMARLENIYVKADESTRYKIISELTDLEYSGAVPLLIKALKNDLSGLVRHEAAFGLGILGNSSHTETMIHAMLNDQIDMVRHEAAIALGEIGGEASIPALLKATNDPNREVAASAQYAMQNIILKLRQNEWEQSIGQR